MITSFEVGTVYKIVDQVTPTLKNILKQTKAANVELDGVLKNLKAIGALRLDVLAADLGRMGDAAAIINKEMGGIARAAGRLSSRIPGIDAVTASIDTQAIAVGALARNWGAVSGAATAAAAASRRASVPPVAPGSGGGGRGGRHGPRPGAGGMFHFGGPSAPVPGGSHVRMRGGAAIAGAGLLGYGAYEAAEMEDAVFQLIYHSAGEQNPENRAKFRGIIQGGMTNSGYELKDIVAASLQEIRMFQGTPGGGIDVLPEMLRAATIEARLKGESPEESMKALIGLAHMTKKYDPESIKKLAPAFAFLSTANPGSLGSIEKAAGYAVPLLQSGLDIDPIQSLLMGTALTRAGATSTKSGTWLREMALRAMPGTSMMSKLAFKKHEQALKAFGLVDDEGKPTWFTNGKPDIFKMLDIAGGKAASIPIEKRAAYERALFGAQGGGGFALLADPAVHEQVSSLRKEMESDEFKNRYAGFTEAYRLGSPVQQARVDLAEFNVVMMDLGSHVLPPVTQALRDFSAAIKYIGSFIPGHDQKADGAETKGKVAARAVEGALAGGVLGSIFPGVGTVGGASGGGVLGGVEGLLEDQNDPRTRATTGVLGWMNRWLMQGVDHAPGPQSSAETPSQPIQLTSNLYIDGQKITEVVTKYMARNGAGAIEGAPYHDNTHSFAPPDFALLG